MAIKIVFSILIAVFVLAIGACVLVLIRKRLSRSAPVIAAAASITVLAGSILTAAGFTGVNAGPISPGLFIVSAFFGTICVQPVPRETSSLLRGLSVACGATAMISALRSDLMVTVVAMFAAGILIRLLAGSLVIKNHIRSEDRSTKRTA